MDLLDKYLDAVGKCLPDAQREDITRELSANILAEFDEREAELGRSLTEDERAGMLRAHGHPLSVAARYAPQRYLIGPQLFPIYWRVLKTALPLVVLVYAIVSAVLIATGAQTVIGAALGLPTVLFTAVAWITLVFAGVEFGVAKYGWNIFRSMDWDPLKLPGDSAPTPPSSFKSACALGLTMIGTAWLIAVPRFPYLMLGPGAAYLDHLPIRLAPIWHALYWPFVALMLARVGLEFLTAFRPSWQGRHWVDAALHAVVVIGAIVFLQAGEYFIVVPGSDAAKLDPIAAGLHRAVLVAGAVTLVIGAAQAIVAARKSMADSRSRRFAPPGSVVL